MATIQFITLLFLLLNINGICTGGITGSYVRKSQSSIDMPIQSFPPPSGYNAPEQVCLIIVYLFSSFEVLLHVYYFGGDHCEIKYAGAHNTGRPCRKECDSFMGDAVREASERRYVLGSRGKAQSQAQDSCYYHFISILQLYLWLHSSCHH